MENLKDYIALKELLSEATEADFSLLPKEMDTPFTRTSSVTFSEEERIIDTVHKISLPCPVIPRYVRIGSEVLSLYLGKKREILNGYSVRDTASRMTVTRRKLSTPQPILLLMRKGRKSIIRELPLSSCCLRT